MGGTTWTTERNERLFVLLLRIAKVDGNAFASLATAYKAEFSKQSS